MVGVVAEAVLKPLRLPVWKAMVDCLDMVVGRGWLGKLLTWVREEGDGEDRASGEPRTPRGFYVPPRGRGALMPSSDGILSASASTSLEPPLSPPLQMVEKLLVGCLASLPPMETPFQSQLDQQLNEKRLNCLQSCPNLASHNGLRKHCLISKPLS